MNALSETIRILLGHRQLTGAQLAEDIGLSATSVGRIVTGHSKPKQVTLTRLMKRLCATIRSIHEAIGPILKVAK